MDWQLAEAKNKLSEVVTRALTEGPQRISRRGEVVVVLAESEFRELTGEKPSFKDFLLNGPDLTGVVFERDRSDMRKVEW
jgi:prevent-host-death family protein